MTTLLPPRSASGAFARGPSLAVACPSCHAALAAPGDAAGTPARCPLCGGAFVIPAPPGGEPTGRDRGADAAPGAPDTGSVGSDRSLKAARRARKNILMLVTGVAILLAIVLLLGTRRPKRRR